jgi:membrane protease YdiL (CAAX protease family)
MAGAVVLAVEINKVALDYLELPSHEEAMEYVIEDFWAWGPLGFVFLISLLPGFAEEVLFRGYLLSGFEWRRSRRWVAALVSGVLFALIHQDPAGNPARAFLGFILGMAALWSGSIFVAMLGHATVNFLGTAAKLASRAYGEETVAAFIESHAPWLASRQTHAPWYLIAAAAALVVVAAAVMKLTESMSEEE